VREGENEREIDVREIRCERFRDSLKKIKLFL
jgi:hypothetical protein